ncbi:MAG: PKD domain-containing protein, partial [Crocinitomicaceae bacterium]|nr:PKD domain-containing protein [Crocinitomicaceae bacterium]
MKQLLYIVIFLLLGSSLFGQLETKYKSDASSPAWIQYMYQDNVNLYELRSLFDNYYKSHDFVKSRHTQYFKRLMKHYSTNVDSEGFILPPVESDFITTQKSPTSPWQEAGPWEYDHEQAMTFDVQSPGSAHVYTVEQSPLNSSLIYAGTATAGLWKSTDKGLNWTLVTKDLDVNSVYSIALDPADQNTVYFGEGNGKIWKSSDAGTNWTMTGDASFQSQNSFVRDLRFIGSNTLLAATDDGLFRSSDAGLNWNNVHPGEHMEIELKPDDSNIIYTVRLSGNKTEFYKSTDNGATWTIKTNGWPSPPSGDQQRRCEISVSAADPNLIHILASGQVGADGGLYGIYKSTDAGESFTFECCDGSPGGTATVANPNILGWSEDGTGEGGQYYYDLAMATSPTDPNRVFGAGINVWRSINGGTSWSINGHWVSWVQGGSLKHRYNHADVHDIKFFENGSDVDMWVASDGGLFYSSSQGDTLEPRMHGIHGTDFWGFGAGFKEGYVMVGGTYHNGTLIRYNDIYKGGLIDPTQGGWLGELGGDNYRGFVNYADANIGYADNGAFNFSPVREERISQRAFDGSMNCNTSYVSGEYGTFGFLPNNYNTFYSPVGNELYKTENGGVSFELVKFFGGDKVIQVLVSWSDPNIIYVTHKIGSDFYIKRSEDGGQTWEIRNPTSAVANGYHLRTKYIEVDDKDPNKLWCILMGSHTGNKVFKSIDGGITWSNITTTAIQNENLRSISHHYGTDDGIYIGTTKRVFYRNASMGDWALFNNNLPASTACNFLQPYYGEGKIRTASQRGVYECDFYEDAAPVAMASANQTTLNLASDCTSDTIYFVDHSTARHASASWQWYFEGGNPSASTLENPSVVYDTPGSYDVKLVVTDAFGADSV